MNNNVRYPARLPNPGTPPKLIRQTHTQCAFGQCTFPISDYSHQFCYFCCLPNTQEYFYHFGYPNVENDSDDD